jgi:hypothetical protein
MTRPRSVPKTWTGMLLECPPALHQAMKQLAAQEGMRFPEVCFEAFREYLRRLGRTVSPPPEERIDVVAHQG